MVRMQKCSLTGILTSVPNGRFEKFCLFDVALWPYKNKIEAGGIMIQHTECHTTAAADILLDQ